MRIGVCTGGGDCPGLNAAIRAVTKHAIGSYGMEVYGIQDSFNGLMDRPMRWRRLKLPDVTDILEKGGTILGTHNAGNPFGKKKQDSNQLTQNVIDGAKELGLDGIVVIGGEGTQAISRTFIDKGLKIIGVPKTIDDDLPGTEQTVGFSTAVDIVSEAVQRLQSTAESHDRIMILEVMGRDSGFIALEGGIAGGAHIILIPEIPFDYDEIERKIIERKKLGRNYSVIVVSEGAKAMKGDVQYQKTLKGKEVLGGIGNKLALELSERIAMESRVTVLGHIQRGGSPNSVDRVLATRLGVKAVDLAYENQWGRIAVLQNNKISDISFNDIKPEERRLLDLEGYAVKGAEGIGISLGRKTEFKSDR